MSQIEASELELWLALAGDPVDDGLYFLGPGERRITFYSQQVRALRLAHALAAAKKVKAGDDVAVIGAGASGLTAAVALALSGATVWLYDPADAVVQLQSASPRLLHPHIYEWPELGSFEASAGLPILNWAATSGGGVCSGLQAEFASYAAALKGRLVFRKRHALEAISQTGSRWKVMTLEILQSGESVTHEREFKTVVLATGFGGEASCENGETLGYWKAGSVDAATDEPRAGLHYLISGTGDGGLTDLMALLVSNFQHVTFAQELFIGLDDDAMRKAVDAACLGAELDTDLGPRFVENVLPVLRARNVLDKLSARLRTDRIVTLNSDRPVLAYGRAARLNQVMAFAIMEAAALAGRSVGVELGRLGVVTRNKGKAAGVSIVLEADGVSRTLVVDRLLCRHGPKTADHYSFAAIHFKNYDELRLRTLAKHVELDGPPIIDPRTFCYFEGLDIDLKPVAVKSQLQAAAARRDAAVLIGMDRATRQLTQRGALDVAVISAQCERLVKGVEIHLDVVPGDLPGAIHWIRLAHASGGRIRLFASAEVLPAWQTLQPKMSAAVDLNWAHRPVLLGEPDIKSGVEDCLLRLLDAAIAACVATGQTIELHAVSPEITKHLAADWAAWRGALAADPALKAEFLRWLFSVEPTGHPCWSGQHSEVSAMGSAVVLMLATHLGEPLTPAILGRGNMQFGADAVAVGSGCSRVASGLVDDWTDPDQWGVDAVVLAGVRELEVVSAFDRLTAGGRTPPDLLTPSRVAPAVIQNNKAWRGHLATGVKPWRMAVEDEFRRWRERQENAMKRFKP